MDRVGKQQSNPFSTGGGGGAFEIQVQTAFAILMLSGGFAPCLEPWPIAEIALQARRTGYRTDDCVVTAVEPVRGRTSRLLTQIKHAVAFTERDQVFGEAIHAAWTDFRNTKLFDPDEDAIALVTGPLSAQDIANVRPLLEWARTSASAHDFVTMVQTANLASDAKRQKLKAFRVQLQAANGGVAVADDRLWAFMRCYHVLGYDLDIRSGVTLSLLNSHIARFGGDVRTVWSRVASAVSYFNQNAGTITRDTLPRDILDMFAERLGQRVVPDAFLRQPDASPSGPSVGLDESLKIASLVGAWNEEFPDDVEAIAHLLGSRE